MSIEFALWRVDEGHPRRLSLTGTGRESQLQEWLIKDLGIVAPELMLIGKEVIAYDNERIDLLAIDRGGKLYALELKRGMARREAVVQLLDYGAWLAEQTIADLHSIYETKCPGRTDGRTLSQAFKERFGVDLPEEVDDSHELWLVVAGMDDRTRRLCDYLADHHQLPINAVFVHLVQDGDRQYLARAWLRDPNRPTESEVDASAWSRDFYTSFGEYPDRSWDEASKFGFFAAGGGVWYSRTLNLLNPGDRIWVRSPGRGYVGVGRVTARAVPVDDFKVVVDGVERPIVEVAPHIARTTRYADDPENAEYVVGVEWIKTVPLAQAINESGFFGNQNSVAKPKAESWFKTLARLKQRFGIAD